MSVHGRRPVRQRKVPVPSTDRWSRVGQLSQGGWSRGHLSVVSWTTVRLASNSLAVARLLCFPRKR